MITDYHARYYAHDLTLKRAGDRVDKLSRSLFDATVDLNPHQIEAALFALRSPTSKGVIIADEVGLGKTIEAGILLCQFWAENKRRLCVVCPASLRKQWALELEEKFNLPVRVLDARSYREHLLDSTDEILILSYHFAARLADDLFHVPWDFVVIDEAHKLRNVYRKDNKIGRALKRAFTGRRKALLTATPLQNSLIELYGLATVIDDFIFGGEAAFRARYTASQSHINELKGRLDSFCWRTLREDVQEYVLYTERHAITVPFEPSEIEQRLYDRVSDFLRREVGHALPYRQRQLTILVMRKLLASSSRAIAGTLETIRQRLEKLGEGHATPVSLIENLVDDDDLEADYIEEAGEEPAESNAEPVPDSLIDEIREVSDLARLARSIEVDAKTHSLLTALETGFSRMDEMGAARKALIFTESRRTQAYLKSYLEDHGYKGRVATFSGTNTDADCKAILDRWLEQNRLTGRATGSRSVDMRTAIVDHFQGDGEVLIATEAAAEGINLQFCSLVINYDLPWNPQRIEQRIGRCHRYGQKHDVVVVNFLNEKNAADQRVYELLSEKFRLFEGVFGASDEILGSLESGMDFEKRILAIYQDCRTGQQIDDAFAALQAEMDEAIQARLSDARLKLFVHFDEDVHARLKMKLNDARMALDRTGRMFWHLTEHMLDGQAVFNGHDLAFELKKSPIANASPGTYRLISKDRDNVPGRYLYRLSHPLGEHVLEAGRTLQTPEAKVVFRISDHPTKISAIEKLKDMRGWLSLHHLVIDSFEREEYLVFTAMDRKQRSLDQETCEKLFTVEGVWSGNAKPMHELLQDIFGKLRKKNIKAVVKRSRERNQTHLEEQWQRLDAWAEDKRNALKLELKDADGRIKDLKKQIRNVGDIQEKLNLRRRTVKLEKDRDTAWRAYDKAAKALERQKDELLDGIEAQLKIDVAEKLLFTIQWKVV